MEWVVRLVVQWLMIFQLLFHSWTLSTLVVLSDGRLYVNVAESFLTPLTTVFSSTGTVRRGGSTVLQKLKITLNLRDTKYLNL